MTIRYGPTLDPRIAELTGETLVDLLDRAVARSRDRAALVLRKGMLDERWSYADLGDRSRRVAARLAALGVGPGDRVVTWAPGDPWLVAAMFATWRLGAAIVPLDLRMMEDVAVRIAGRTRPALVLAGEAQADGPARSLGAPVVRICAAELDQGPDAGLPADRVLVEPSMLAEIVFTSGTTSDPKGVCLTHGQVVHNARVIAQRGMGPRPERALAIIPLSHMYGQIVPLFLGLISGSTLVFLATLSSTSIGTALRHEGITAITAVPQLTRLILDMIESEAERRGELERMQRARRVARHLPMPVRRRLFRRVHETLSGHLEIITSGGAAMPPDLQAAWESMGVLVVQGYGGTECAAISGHSRASRRPGTAGSLLAGLAGQVAPDGELLVRGPSVMSGYWEAPVATAEVLTPDGWLHTGDAVRFDERGELIVLGRTRDRIALPSGLKVYPDDVELALRETGTVREAVVLESPPGRLVAVLVPADPDAPDEVLAGAVKAANATLAVHQRVSAWRRWPEADLPRTHTLKVRRQPVRAWYEAAAAGLEAEGPRVQAVPPLPPPADPMVELCCLVAEVTTVPGGPAPSVTPGTALADLPLDSLRRVTLALRVEEVLGVPLTDDAVVGAATVADLAARIAAGGEEKPSVPDVAWARSAPACLVREVLDRTFIRWLLAIVARPHVEGFEHVAGLSGPALLCPNHTSHLDGPSVRLALPPDRRRRTLVAAAADYHVAGWLLGPAFALITAAFPFGRLNDVRASLERVGDLLSEGWSVVVFPEGTRSTDGRLGEMREGIGLLAVGTGLPVVPTWIEGAHAVLPSGHALPRRRKGARLVVRFGDPLRFGPDTPTTEATAAVGRAITGLRPRTG